MGALWPCGRARQGRSPRGRDDVTRFPFRISPARYSDPQIRMRRRRVSGDDGLHGGQHAFGLLGVETGGAGGAGGVGGGQGVAA